MTYVFVVLLAVLAVCVLGPGIKGAERISLEEVRGTVFPILFFCIFSGYVITTIWLAARRRSGPILGSWLNVTHAWPRTRSKTTVLARPATRRSPRLPRLGRRQATDEKVARLLLTMKSRSRDRPRRHSVTSAAPCATAISSRESRRIIEVVRVVHRRADRRSRAPRILPVSPLARRRLGSV